MPAYLTPWSLWIHRSTTCCSTLVSRRERAWVGAWSDVYSWPADLKSTAFFIGGSSVSAGQAILDEVRNSFFGPIRCSVMFDGNGSNTRPLLRSCRPRGMCRSQDRAVSYSAEQDPLAEEWLDWWLVKVDTFCLVSRDQSKADSVCQQIGCNCKARALRY